MDFIIGSNFELAILIVNSTKLIVVHKNEKKIAKHGDTHIQFHYLGRKYLVDICEFKATLAYVVRPCFKIYKYCQISMLGTYFLKIVSH